MMLKRAILIFFVHSVCFVWSAPTNEAQSGQDAINANPSPPAADTQTGNDGVKSSSNSPIVSVETKSLSTFPINSTDDKVNNSVITVTGESDDAGVSLKADGTKDAIDDTSSSSRSITSPKASTDQLVSTFISSNPIGTVEMNPLSNDTSQDTGKVDNVLQSVDPKLGTSNVESGSVKVQSQASGVTTAADTQVNHETIPTAVLVQQNNLTDNVKKVSSISISETNANPINITDNISVVSKAPSENEPEIPQSIKPEIPQNSPPVEKEQPEISKPSMSVEEEQSEIPKTSPPVKEEEQEIPKTSLPVKEQEIPKTSLPVKEQEIPKTSLPVKEEQEIPKTSLPVKVEQEISKTSLPVKEEQEIPKTSPPVEEKLQESSYTNIETQDESKGIPLSGLSSMEPFNDMSSSYGNPQLDDSVFYDDDSSYKDDEGLGESDINVGEAQRDVVPINMGKFTDDADSHFFAYFLTIMVTVIIFYLVFHNKQRIIALIIEGRAPSGDRSRRSSSRAKYHKLDNNLEEAITATKGSKFDGILI